MKATLPEGTELLQKGTVIEVRKIIGPTAEMVLKPLGEGTFLLLCDAYVVGMKMEDMIYQHLYQAREYEPGHKIMRNHIVWRRLRHAIDANGGISVKIPYCGEPLHYEYERAVKITPSNYYIVRECDLSWYLAHCPSLTDEAIANRQQNLDWARAGFKLFVEMAPRIEADVYTMPWTVVVMGDLDDDGQAGSTAEATFIPGQKVPDLTVFKTLRKVNNPERILWRFGTKGQQKWTHSQALKFRFVLTRERFRIEWRRDGKWKEMHSSPVVYLSKPTTE